jgi:1-acyl-sn-glycerol-3-phosphate acyltransferase
MDFLPEPSARLLSFFATTTGRRVLSGVVDYFHATLQGSEHIPRDGGALIVSNHAAFAIDSVVLGALLVRDFGRNPRFLVDRKLWSVPGVSRTIGALGALAGEPNNAATLLRRGELVIVYPGGVDDSLKLVSQRYELQWRDRAGFARLAIAARVPIIPVVGLGIDDMYSVVAREHWVGRRVFGSARYDLPLALGAFGTLIPRRAQQTYIALPAIDTSGDAGSSADVERVRSATFEALETRLRRERAQVA